MPSVRFVLLKGIDERGVEFFTNYESRKGRELIANPRAALAVLWKPLHRQVRLEGPVEVLTPEESDAYFATRSRGSQLGAWASRQSEVIPDREWLEARLRELDARVPGRGAAPAALGRLPPAALGDRVLAGPPEPPPRPRAVRPAARAAGSASGYRRRADPAAAADQGGVAAPGVRGAAPRLGRGVVRAAGVRVGDEREVGDGSDAVQQLVDELGRGAVDADRARPAAAGPPRTASSMRSPWPVRSPSRQVNVTQQSRSWTSEAM